MRYNIEQSGVVMRGKSRPRKGARAGFSLLELIAVMVIVAVVLAVAMPRMRGFFASRHLENTATNLLVMTRYAQTRAVTDGRPYRLNIDVNDREFFLSVPGAQGYEQPRNDFGNLYELPGDLDIQWRDTGEPAQRGYLEFLPDGSTDVATLRLTDKDDNMLEVRCLSPSESFEIRTPPEALP